MTATRLIRLAIRRPVCALASDQRGGTALETAMMLAAGILSALQVAALTGLSLQRGFAPVSAAIAALNGN